MEMNMNNTLMQKYVDFLVEESRKVNPDNPYPYVVGLLQTQLTWALGEDYEREIIKKNILEDLVNIQEDLRLGIK